MSELFSLFQALVTAYMYGYLEQIMYRNGFKGPDPHLFGYFSVYYHLPMLLFWEWICYLLGVWWAIGLFAVTEDDAYFRFHPTETRDDKDWINFKLGGFKLFGAWIPYTYLIGIGISGVLYFFERF